MCFFNPFERIWILRSPTSNTCFKHFILFTFPPICQAMLLVLNYSSFIILAIASYIVSHVCVMRCTPIAVVSCRLMVTQGIFIWNPKLDIEKGYWIVQTIAKDWWWMDYSCKNFHWLTRRSLRHYVSSFNPSSYPINQGSSFTSHYLFLSFLHGHR